MKITEKDLLAITDSNSDLGNLTPEQCQKIKNIVFAAEIDGDYEAVTEQLAEMGIELIE